jgi:L-asparaginase/Glu-tRNA(Gln) amidotransferase subunit D
VPFRRNNLTPDIQAGVSVVTIHTAMKAGEILYQARPKTNNITIVKTLGEGNVPDRLIPDIEELVHRKKNMVILTTQFP